MNRTLVGINTTSGIYRIYDTFNNFSYIGSSVNCRDRLSHHFSSLRGGRHRNYLLQTAWEILGEDSFLCEILISCPADLLCFYEQQFLDLLVPEYNISKDVFFSPWRGKHLTAEHRENISKATRGLKRTVETKLRMGLAQIGNTKGLGKHPSESTRAKLSLSKKGKTRTFESRLKHSKLTLAQIIDVKKRSLSGESTSKLAIEFGITKSAVHKIKIGVLWKDIVV